VSAETGVRPLVLPVSGAHLARAGELRRQFASAEPFPLVVLDDFLDPQLAQGLLEEFPDVTAMPRTGDGVFGDKRELAAVAGAGPSGRRFHEAMTSPAFASFLGEVTGFDVFVDPDLFGGGFHQGADGSYLDMHVDFNIHPHKADWLRMLNILVYLNPNWDEAWGGHLLVKSAVEQEPRAIAPVFNRAVIMRTADNTFHGYRRMSLPTGVTRRSVAVYAYRQVRVGEYLPHSTNWVPERGLGRKAVAQYLRVRTKVKNILRPPRA